MGSSLIGGKATVSKSDVMIHSSNKDYEGVGEQKDQFCDLCTYWTFFLVVILFFKCLKSTKCRRPFLTSKLQYGIMHEARVLKANKVLL